MISLSLRYDKPLMCAMLSGLFIEDDYDRPPILYKENIVLLSACICCLELLKSLK